MGAMKTPGVYVIEKSAFPNPVVEVATAIPAFIGYTEFAENGLKSLLNTPWKINSLAEFIQYFGNAPKPRFKFKGVENGSYTVSRKDTYTFFYNMMFFFANGGGPCYIVSVGNYDNTLNHTAFMNGLDMLEKEQEPTMVVIPEAVQLSSADMCNAVQKKMLTHCGTMQNRVAIIDVYNGDKERTDPVTGDVVTKFREAIGTEFLNYGSAYYPWLNTSIVSENDITFMNIEPNSLDEFKSALKISSPGLAVYSDAIGISTDKDILETAHKVLYKQSPLYADILKDMFAKLNLLPPSAAMAGIYTLTDNTKEVWKAPANVGISRVISPTVAISYEQQEDLNVPQDGKAINAIRYFTGEGIKVWGARTLDGNSPDWRYINIRRTMIMLEESIKMAAKAFAFDPNTANTWIILRSMISNFLNGIWKRGGLVGATPEDAYSVHIGLGETMTPDDILDGLMNIVVLVAISHPAEFIEIVFRQQMQKS